MKKSTLQHLIQFNHRSTGHQHICIVSFISNNIYKTIVQNSVLLSFFKGSAPVDSHSPLKLGNITSMHNLNSKL